MPDGRLSFDVDVRHLQWDEVGTAVNSRGASRARHARDGKHGASHASVSTAWNFPTAAPCSRSARTNRLASSSFSTQKTPAGHSLVFTSRLCSSGQVGGCVSPCRAVLTLMEPPLSVEMTGISSPVTVLHNKRRALPNLAWGPAQLTVGGPVVTDVEHRACQRLWRVREAPGLTKAASHPKLACIASRHSPRAARMRRYVLRGAHRAFPGRGVDDGDSRTVGCLLPVSAVRLSADCSVTLPSSLPLRLPSSPREAGERTTPAQRVWEPRISGKMAGLRGYTAIDQDTRFGCVPRY